SNAINEIDNTDLVFIFGYNPADSHPIVGTLGIRAPHTRAPINLIDAGHKQTARLDENYSIIHIKNPTIKLH
ncbi:molybdopterin-dependent oxidoreductase, partial [Enterobacter hormaechei]